jgi:hypothetical protein
VGLLPNFAHAVNSREGNIEGFLSILVTTEEEQLTILGVGKLSPRIACGRMLTVTGLDLQLE